MTIPSVPWEKVGWLVYAVLVAPPARIHVPPLAGLALGVSTIAATRIVLNQDRDRDDTDAKVTPPPWDLWARAGVTAALVVALTTAAGDLGAAVAHQRTGPAALEQPRLWPAVVRVHREAHRFTDNDLSGIARVTTSQLADLWSSPGFVDI